MAFSINLTDNERKLACAYAKMHSITLGEAFKHALFEKIEDEYDTKIADEAYEEYINNGKESRPIEELWEELDRLSKIHKITWVKVKGHADNIYNNRCDELARGEISN